ncbi:MAG: GH116 family glycosyl hydrolase [Armatimonadota bacterium]|nr:GH116 family glycosyl hydrolase [Armatimonadota bacterium]
MPLIHAAIAHTSGIPLGGIGAGSVEIRPDGLLHEWQIFNAGRWAPQAPCGLRPEERILPEDCVFVLRVATPGDVQLRYLALRESLHDLYSAGWARAVQSIQFEGTFPLARLRYLDDSLPVQVTAEVFSPFIPLDSRASGTPGFFIRFLVRNRADVPVDVSIAGVLRNMVGLGQESRQPRNHVRKVRDALALHLQADGLQPDHCSTGDMTFAARGGEVSYITGGYRDEYRSLMFWRNRFGIKPVSVLRRLREEGRLPNLAPKTAPALPEGVEVSHLTVEEREVLLQQLLQYPFVYDHYHRLCQVEPSLARSADFLQEVAMHLDELRERGAEWGYAALCSRQQVNPECEGEALFTVSWFFPNHLSPSGANIGHQYARWFSSSLEVADYLMGNASSLRERTLTFVDAIVGSSLPPEVADAVSGQLTTLVKCTWWTKEGHFGVWEGLGCCGFHTTDITYQGSFPILALFPDLQKAQMEHGAKFQREDGRVHHFFTPDFSAVDNGFDRVDMNPQFVMLVTRDYFWTGDRGYLERLYPHVVRAMDNTLLLDRDGDALPDTDTRRNTYDVWDFQGSPAYICSLWLGALQSAARLAQEMGDSERAAQWRGLYEQGVHSFIQKLWNGEYFVLWRDGDLVDECCMSDQLSAEWFFAASGWSPLVPEEYIERALDAILRYNFRRGEGLRNASYPPGKPHRLAASSNLQAEGLWTGIEYTVAALLIARGRLAEGMAIVRDIHDRYLRAGRFWNHVECGDHYYRAMSAWTLLNAFTGLGWNAVRSEITFAPVLHAPESYYPFFTPTAWGVYSDRTGAGHQQAEIAVADGALRLCAIQLPRWQGGREVSVVVDEQPVNVEVAAEGRGITLRFVVPVTLSGGQRVCIVG